METLKADAVERLYAGAESSFADWELLKDVTDELIDLALNYRQSGHPGGSRSKVHLFLLDAAVGGDALGYPPSVAAFRRPVRAVGRPHRAARLRTLAVLNEVMRARSHATTIRRSHSRTTDAWRSRGRTCRAAPPWRPPGHAEMAGKTLFLKFNTGPSGHGMPPAAGEALALKLAGADGVKVFVVEGEGGLTAGASHETRNAAWGLGLSNLVFLVDWNDYGIDDFAASSVVHGTPADWFSAYGWRVTGNDRGHASGDRSRRPCSTPPAARTPRARAVVRLVPDEQGTRLRQERLQAATARRTP